MRIPAAPCRKVGAVYASRLNEADGREGLALSQLQGFMAKPGLNRPEPLDANSLFHLGEVGFGGNCAAIAAGSSQEVIPIKPLHQVLHVGYLLQLA